VSQWSDAIALMKAVPASNPTKRSSKQRLPNTSGSTTYAKRQATRPIQQKPDRVVDFVPETPPSHLRVSNTAQEAPPPMQSNQTVFQAPIKRRAGGTPVINVTFSGTQQ